MGRRLAGWLRTQQAAGLSGARQECPEHELSPAGLEAAGLGKSPQAQVWGDERRWRTYRGPHLRATARPGTWDAQGCSGCTGREPDNCLASPAKACPGPEDEDCLPPLQSGQPHTCGAPAGNLHPKTKQQLPNAWERAVPCSPRGPHVEGVTPLPRPQRSAPALHGVPF